MTVYKVLRRNTWGNETLNKPNFNEISFNYITRDLKEKSFVNGAPFVQDKLLNDIVVKSNNSQFKKYVIEYFKNGTNYQFANKITEYNNNKNIRLFTIMSKMNFAHTRT